MAVYDYFNNPFPVDGGSHRQEFTGNHPISTVVMVIYHYVDIIRELSLPPIFCIIYINKYICYIKNGGNENSPNSINVMVNYHYHIKTG